jgi:hypothetical protein
LEPQKPRSRPSAQFGANHPKLLEPSIPAIADFAKQIRRLKTEWELNQNNAPGMFQRAKDILGALHSVITGILYRDCREPEPDGNYPGPERT